MPKTNDDLKQKNIEKMAALGQMTRGIVHDFNNSIASIMGYADFLMEDLPADSEQRSFAENIRKAGYQLQSMMSQIRAVAAEKNAGKDRTFDVVEEIRILANSALPELKDGQNILLSSDIQLAVVTLPHHQFQIMIGNIIRNAIQSLGQTSGKVTIHIAEYPKKTQNDVQSYDADLKLVAAPQTKSPLISIDITDTGCGMVNEILHLAALPHFTTKSEDMAHGMGLTVTKEIISYLGGGLFIASTPHKGTSVRLILPVENSINKEKSRN